MSNNFKPQLSLNVEGLVKALNIGTEGVSSEFISSITTFVERDLYKTVEQKFMDLSTRADMSDHIQFQIAMNWVISSETLIKENRLSLEDIQSFIFGITYSPVSLNIFNDKENHSLNEEIIYRFKTHILNK